MNTERAKTVCFSGHRPSKLPLRNSEGDLRCKFLKLQLLTLVFHSYEIGYRNFICGMAQGVDMYAAEAVLAIKDSLDSVKLICAVPYRGHLDAQGALVRARYEGILGRADSVVTLADAYNARCMRRRNEYMVDNSACLIAVYDGERGGTHSTIAYARKQGLDLRIIAPLSSMPA